ncbi:hypothetical protein DFH11DRAFT_1526941, partial [Phellopilus nigrolimitatus]
FVFVFLRESFEAALQRYHLIFHFDLALDMKVADLLQLVVSRMRESPSQYQLGNARHAMLLSHETIGLRLLSLVNKGKPRRGDKQIRLRVMAITQELTVRDLAGDKTKYAAPVCIEGNRFIIHAAASCFPLRNGEGHGCVSSLMYSLFPFDSEQGAGASVIDECPGDQDICNIVSSRSSPHPAGPSSVSAPAPLVGPLSSEPTIRLPQYSSFVQSESILPSSIWSSSHTWSAEIYDGLYPVESFSDAVYDSATAGPTVSTLRVSGSSVAAIAAAFAVKIDDAVSAGDFSCLLSPRRDFEVDDGEAFSHGQGIEREAIFLAFSEFTRHDSQWLLPRCDDMSTIKTLVSGANSRWVSPSRLQNMKRFGAIVAFMIISGQAPSPLDPCLLHFIAHGCNIHSLHPSFVGEWHPELRANIHRWKEMGPSGDVAAFEYHFASYHDMQASSLAIRDETMHEAIAGDMLYRSIIGPESHRHPEIRAFVWGFSLPCPDSAFTFLDVLRKVDGGSEALLSRIWTAFISDFVLELTLLTSRSPLHHSFLA